MNQKPYSFLFGAQYYRAPTPEPECWEADHHKMAELGFNHVKYWVQWRWSHRLNDQFVFDDLDRLMDLAWTNGLKVTLNTVFDVSPHWLYDVYPDARQISCDGHIIEPYTVAHRQIGGHPGPCYNHPATRIERQKFLHACIEHFHNHPALAMWDIWNEPELCFPQRTPNVEKMVCYCLYCQKGFLEWLHRKYTSLEQLNQVWGRCYETWEQVELPRNPHTITDYIDWREFHIDTMTAEAAWRLEMVRELDPVHIHYLHVVPNVMSIFNSVSCCADDFKLAEMCQVFAATMNGGPVYAPQVLSAARGKVCYNVESHVNFGMTNMHQRILSVDDLLRDWLPQIGLGIRGFLFWQYRPEILGFEAPAWGVVNPDGSDRPVTDAVKTFWHKISPYVPELMDYPAKLPEIGIWKSRKNEIFHFCIHNHLGNLVESVEGYVHILYWKNYSYRFINSEMLEKGELAGIKLLILPSCYYLTEAEAKQLDAWVRKGGVVLVEAHLAGYNGTTGRHSRQVPGCGLAESWGIHEIGSTSSYHLKLVTQEVFQNEATEDVRKALVDFDTSGGKFFPIRLINNQIIWGAEQYAQLAGKALKPLGWFGSDSVPCLGYIDCGHGEVIYCGTNLGQGANQDAAGLTHLLQRATSRAGISPLLGLRSDEIDRRSSSTQVRMDPIFDQSDQIHFIVVQSQPKPYKNNQPFAKITLTNAINGFGLYSRTRWDYNPGESIQISPELIDFIILDKEK